MPPCAYYSKVCIWWCFLLHNVILYGNYGDSKITDILISDLHESKSLYCLHDKIFNSNKNPEIAVIETEAANVIESDEIGICIFKLKSDVKNLKKISENIFCVVSSENTEIINKLSKLKANVIMCGMSGRCTVNFSSLKQDSAVISLNRSLKNIYGNIIEPLDIPINRFESGYEYEYLASAVLNLFLK